MSSPRKSHPIDALHRIMSSLEHFENKLDKLQDDVRYHGQTLTDLRAMVTVLSGGTIVAADPSKAEEIKRILKKTLSSNYEENINLDDAKTKRKGSVQPLTQKAKEKLSSQTQKSVTPQTSPYRGRKKVEMGTKGISQKHAQRHRKAEAQRKTNMIRTQKLVENKRILKRTK